MAISLKSMLVVGGGLGLLYAVSPRFRHATKPLLMKLTDRWSGSSRYNSAETGYQMPETYYSQMDIDIEPQEDVEDLKAIMRSMASRLSRVEKSVGVGLKKTNEYQPDFYMQ